MPVTKHSFTYKLTIALCILAFPLHRCSGQEVPQAIQGSWTLRDVYKTPNVQGPSPSEAHTLIGSHVVIDSKELKSCGHRITISSVEVQQVTPEEFLANTKVRTKWLGLKCLRCTEVIINGRRSGSCFGAFPLPGQDVYIKDSGRLVIYFEGIFYDAVRESASQ
jgi:hypothetical protein